MPLSHHAPLFLLLLAAAPAARQVSDDPLPAKDAAITRAELEHHVRFLASDELQGRAPFTPGSQRAARYLASALQAAGVEPAGDDGTYFQALDVRRYSQRSAPRLLCTKKDGTVVEGKLGVDFDLRLRGRALSTEVLPLRMFTGKGAKRLPVQGDPKQAIFFDAAPNERRAAFEELGIQDFSSWGLEVVLTDGPKSVEPGNAKPIPPPRTVPASATGECESVELRGTLRNLVLDREILYVQLVVDEVEAPEVEVNVVGRIRGAGTPQAAELAQEAVVLSAHYDHLGVRRPRGDGKKSEEKEPADKDVICNGADDDASGCAALLELAQAFAAGAKPARTLVFLFTSCEESGGFGSARYLTQPCEPLARTVADLNLEMLGRPDEKIGGAGKLWLTGAERTNLGAAWRERGLAIADDPRPDEKFFQRSDNYAFALRGVVAQSLSSFNLHQDYHQPSDEADTLDYAHLEAAARLAHLAATTLADGSLKPAWVEGRAPKPVGAVSLHEGLGERRGPRPQPPADQGGSKDEDG